MADKTVTEITLADITPDSKNANKGNERGAVQLENSLRQYGAGRSILLDKNNRIIAGNKTYEQAGQIGLDNLLVIETDGTQLVAVKRTDIDIDTKQGRELAIADNRTSQVGLEWDTDVLKGLADEDDVDLSIFWREDELAALFAEDATPDFEAAGIDEQGKLDQKALCVCPSCGYEHENNPKT
jgi:sporulation protein YlmC with PRC-barrel domain